MRDLFRAAKIDRKEIESNAALISTKQDSAKFPLDIVCSIMVTTLCSASSVDLPFLNPSWSLLRELSMWTFSSR